MRLMLDESMTSVIECIGGLAVLTIIGTFFAFTTGAIPSDSNVYAMIWEVISTLVG